MGSSVADKHHYICMHHLLAISVARAVWTHKDDSWGFYCSKLALYCFTCEHQHGKNNNNLRKMNKARDRNRHLRFSACPLTLVFLLLLHGHTSLGAWPKSFHSI